MKFAIVDIETTGGHAQRDKITEVAVYIHDGEKIVEEFNSLINPQKLIPPYISKLTGITDEMVADAPKFYEVAKQLVQIMDGATFVAHNAAFDYSFIREEFKSLGYNFNKEYLCTVKLSRKLLPGFKSYSLGNLCRDLGITIENRHRAHGDALATTYLFQMLLDKGKNNDIIRSLTKNDYVHLKFPPGFDTSILNNLPEEAGVYYFYNEDGSLIYIGKSNNIRKRVLTHFANKQTRRALEMRNAIKDISFEVTGNELIALLLESEEIKIHQPVFNRAQKKLFFNYGIFQNIDENGYINFEIKKTNQKTEPILTTSNSEEAKAIIEKLTSKFNLCKKLAGIYDIAHACFAYSVNQCKGACVGKESQELYNERANKAIDSLKYKHHNFLIVGKGRTLTEISVVQIEKGLYKGFGYYDTEFGQPYPDLLRDAIKPRTDNRDIHKIIRHFLHKTDGKNIVVY